VDVSMIIEFINTVGYPIACAAVMFWMLDKERKDHKEESDKLVEALNNNTIVLEQIKAVLIDRGHDISG